MNNLIKSIQDQKYPILFFLIYFVIGISIYKDYGIGWDEGICIRSGVINSLEINKNFNYLILSKEKVNQIIYNAGYGSKISDLDKFMDKYYGSINEIILLAPSFILKTYNDTQSVIHIRHFMIFFLFWLSTIFFYKILFDRFNNIFIALIGTSFLILSPRIFADSFYNSKDLVFLSFTIIAIYTSLKFLDKRNIKYAIIHALASAIIIDIRIPGIFIPALTYLFLLLFAIRDKSYSKNTFILPLIVYSISLIVFVIMFWPYLWSFDPLGRFVAAFNRMSNFPYILDVFYLGKLLKPSELPWHYSFVWILITTPIYISALFTFGLGILLLNFKKFKVLISDDNFIKDIFLLLCFVFPLFVVIYLNSTLYNGWRQLFFIYPGIIFIATFGFHKLLYLKQNKKYKYSIIAVFVALLSFTTFQMISMHPYQMVYFNFLAGDDPKKNFDYEYWGLSYLEGINKVLDKEQHSEKIKIFRGEFSPIAGTGRILEKKDRDRVEFTEFHDARYFITNYSEYFNNEIGFKKRYKLAPYQEIDSITVNDIKILSIFKLDDRNYIDSSFQLRILNDRVKYPNKNL